MIFRALSCLGFAALLIASSPAAQAARVRSDLQPAQKRQTSVANAERLAQKQEIPPLPADLISPFNPPNFDQPDPADQQAALAEAQRAAAANPGAPVPVAVPGNRETLEKLAEQITPSGTIIVRGTTHLVIGNKPFEVGTRFTATYNNQDYELELVSIDRTTFTLRYRGEEITRPIKPVR